MSQKRARYRTKFDHPVTPAPTLGQPGQSLRARIADEIRGGFV